MVLNKQDMINYLESNYGSWDDVVNLSPDNLKATSEKGWSVYNTRTPSKPEYSLKYDYQFLCFLREDEVYFKPK